uniref:Proline rich 35 n=1 Tax=Hucho hucho TaxID=62062 RepID=A0A4W5QIY6_9TELE
MSKEGHACKVTSVCKHKERKPKKPHYIPRPWGKPYNYKCFQCPFTCMEKSHLYNHMKYSLCKNSLSLLIESDWPYKKGNLLHPDQLRPLQQEDGDNGQSPAGEEERGQGEGAEGPEPELLMADMFSLEDQLLRARSVEVEAQLKHYKLSKTCLTAPGLLSEQWRLLATSQTKAKSEGAQPRVGSSIPCYPLPPGLVDYQDPTGLNLSVLGVGYPLSPSLFSYVNSMNLAQLPFLASAAQLMQPASGGHHPVDRSLLPPHFYYPFLCEHAFGAASAQSDISCSQGGEAKLGPQEDRGHLGDPQVPCGEEASPRVHPGPPQEHSENQTNRKPAEQWYTDPPTSPVSDSPSLPRCRRPSSQDSTTGQGTGEASSEPTSAAALLSDLSKALQEYQEAECKIAHLEKEDLPAQGHLWEHLNKIRSELSHIHHALERTARQSEGPLDLSVKKEHPGVTDVVATGNQGLEGTSLKDDITMETEEEDEETKERDEEEKENERRKEAMKASLESRKQSLDVLIKMSQVGVKTEVLSTGGLGLRPSQAEGLWPGRTTKCEADSSVLLCPDGRPLAVFNDFPTFSTENSKRPPSIQQLREPQCPLSPLTTIDS